MFRPTRLGVVMLGGAVLLAWWAAASPSAPDPAEGVRGRAAVDEKQRARQDAIIADLEAQADRLRARLASAPAPAPNLRDPFRYRARGTENTASAAVSSTPAPPATTVASEVDVAPRRPALRLVGLAEHREAGLLVRRAILASAHDLLIVSAGEMAGSRYRVLAVDAEAVELEDVASGTRLTLTLP